MSRSDRSDVDKMNWNKYNGIVIVTAETEAINIRKQNQINHLLARFLEQDEQNDDDYDESEPDAREWYNTEVEERKRSVFRERGNGDGEQDKIEHWLSGPEYQWMLFFFYYRRHTLTAECVPWAWIEQCI